MAEDYSGGGERTEPATPRRRREAREKGQVPRSQDFNTAIVLLVASVLVFFLARTWIEQLAHLKLSIFDRMGTERITVQNVVTYGTQSVIFLVQLILPLAATLLIIGFLANLLQVGFLVTLHPITPNPSRLNPLQGLMRIFSRRGVMRFLFGLLKLAVVSTVLLFALRGLFSFDSVNNLFGVLNTSLWEALDFSNQALFSVGVRAAAALLVLALFDVLFQRMQHEKDLMMTKQEVRDELKQMEGDPKLKERRRQIQNRLILQRMMLDVPQADVVITNPVHVACAVRYRAETMPAPRLVAKGKARLAHRIREVAIEAAVPVVEEPPLARRIFDATEVGQEIPSQLYEPLAEVLAYVYRLGRNRERAGV